IVRVALLFALGLAIQGTGCAMLTVSGQRPGADLAELGRLYDAAEQGLSAPNLTDDEKRNLQDGVAGRCDAIAGNHIMRAEGKVRPPNYSSEPIPPPYDVEKPMVPTQRGLLTIREVYKRCYELSNPFFKREKLLTDDPNGRKSILTREQVWDGWPYKEEK